MAFLVEDGTGVAGANSLTTVLFFREYFADRGTDVTALLDPVVEQTLIKATDYLVKRFGTRFIGSRATETQVLPFPRANMYIDGAMFPDNVVPIAIQQATAEYAFRAKDIFLAPDIPVFFDRVDPETGEVISAGGIVQRKREKVDVLEEETEFGLGDGEISSFFRKAGTRTLESWMIPAYPAADLLVEPFLKNIGRVVR